MSEPERFEVLILGSGEAGKLLAWHMAGPGRRTAVVERRWVSGSCPNIACLPSRNEIWSARIAHLTRHAAKFGTTTGTVATDMTKVRQRKRGMVSGEVAFHLQAYKTSGTELIMGSARFTASKTLEQAGVELDGRGYIRVDERLETTAPDVWAMGECAGSPQFTHVSHDDFRIIRDNLAGGQRSTRDRLVPYCMFTDPPLAHVGLHEAEAQREGIDVRVARLPMRSVLRTETTGETRGFMKTLIGGADDRVLGFTMVGAEAGEVMAVVQMAMLADLPYPRLRDAVLAHPTMAEGLGSLFANVPP